MKKILCSLLFASCSFVAMAKTPALNLDLQEISVSGLSSGGYMANQFHIAHSDWVKGAGIIAAGPYYCAQNSIKTALDQCVSQVNSPINLKGLEQQVRTWAKTGEIADPEHLKNSKVWLLHGKKDVRVTDAVSDALYSQYQGWIAPNNIQYVKDKPFAHHFPSLANGNKCDVSAAPFIGKCGYDAAGELLNFIYTDLQPRTNKSKGEIFTVDQQVLGGESASSLADKGYVYVPQSCQQGESCRLHISFHGCQQNAQTVGKAFVEQNGLNNWADNNHMLVLYPQTKNSLVLPLNPHGCWDWWGYSGSDYATKNAKQIQAVRSIAQSLAGITTGQLGDK